MRIVLADGRPAVRSALRLLLEHEAGIRIAGEAGDVGGLLGLLRSGCPDLILLDWGLPGRRPEELLAALRALYPHLRLVVLSGRPEAARAALAAGANAFVSKGDPPERLLAALQAVAAPLAGREEGRSAQGKEGTA